MVYNSQKERYEMSKISTYKLACKTWQRFGAGLFVILSITICCFLLALSLLSGMLEEQQQPYELIVVSEKITNSNLADIQKIENVISATPVLEIPASIQIGRRNLEITVQGVNKGYLHFSFSYGSNEQNSSPVPYLIMNEIAVNSLIDSRNGEKPETLFSKQVLLKFEGKNVVGHLSGIFDDKTEEPKAYIDLSSAKNLLLQNGIPISYSTVYIRCLNSGKTEGITSALTNMGLSVQNENTELEQKWSILSLKITYLFVFSTIILSCSLFLMRERKKADTFFSGHDKIVLQAIGLPEKAIRKLNGTRRLIFLLFAAASGTIIFLLLNGTV